METSSQTQPTPPATPAQADAIQNTAKPLLSFDPTQKEIFSFFGVTLKRREELDAAIEARTNVIIQEEGFRTKRLLEVVSDLPQTAQEIAYTFYMAGAAADYISRHAGYITGEAEEFEEAA